MAALRSGRDQAGFIRKSNFLKSRQTNRRAAVIETVPNDASGEEV